MSHHLPHHLKRLQHDINPHSSDHRSRFPNDEAMRESIDHFSKSAADNTKYSRPFKPAPHRARRGGGGGGHGRPRDRYWNSSLSLPRRAINYDLAESFVDHSTNPLLSDLYKIKFKHSAKQWPNGRFMNYKEKLDKSDGNIIEINCTRTFPIVPKRKKIPETSENKPNDQLNVATTALLLTSLDPVVQEEKKKQINKQTNVYANLFGVGRIPRLSSNPPTKKPNSSTNRPSVPSTISLLDQTPAPQAI